MGWVIVIAGLAAAVVVLVFAARRLGGLAVRIIGGALFVAAVLVVMTELQTYWLSTQMTTPVLVTAPVAALIGLAAVVSGGSPRLTLGGLSGASGLLALACVAVPQANLPEIGSYQRDQLAVAVVALGFLALASGVAAAAPLAGRGRRRAHAAGAAIAFVGVVVTVITAQRSFPIYGSTSDQATMIAVGAFGALALFALGIVLLTPILRRVAAPAPTPVPSELVPASPVPASPVPAPPVPAPPVRAPPAPSAAGAGAAAAAGAPAGGRNRLETAATIIGLATGVVALARELVNLLRAVFG